MMQAYAYIVECVDGTYYTGWTTDLTARVAAHNAGGTALESAGVQGSNGICIYDLKMVSTGLTLAKAKRIAFTGSDENMEIILLKSGTGGKHN